MVSADTQGARWKLKVGESTLVRTVSLEERDPHQPYVRIAWSQLVTVVRSYPMETPFRGSYWPVDGPARRATSANGERLGALVGDSGGVVGDRGDGLAR